MPQVGTAGQQPPTPQNYAQMNHPSPASVGSVGPGTPQPSQYQQQQQQQQPQSQPPPQPQQTQANFNYSQTQQVPGAAAASAATATGASVPGGAGPGKQVQIWEGQIEWAEKDRNNPNIKVNHTTSAVMYSFTAIDPATGQLVSEVPLAASQTWPSKISLQMMSKQILDILSPWCGPPARNLILYTDNQDVKNALTNVGVRIKQSLTVRATCADLLKFFKVIFREL